jgi:nucleoid DNA-binding protein
MTKRKITNTLAQEMGLSQTQVKAIVQLVFDGIIQILVKEGRVELRNFGVFEVKRRKPRQARNPKTGEVMNVPARMVVHFKAGRVMAEKVKGLKRVGGQK